MPGMIALGVFVTLALSVVTVAVLQGNVEAERRMVASVDPASMLRTGLAARLDDRLRGTRWGTRLTALLAGAGLASWSPAMFLATTAAGAAVVGLVALPLLGNVTAVAAVVATVAAVRRWLDRRRRARVDRFVAQLPELARLLANGAQAGLAVRRALELAAREMDEPAASEVAQVTSEMELGRTLTAALAGLSERLPSRELSVLVQTLAIQGRAGGTLVTALTGIAGTLDERRQLRREIATATVGASFSGYTVIFMAAASVVLMNVMSPGVMDDMISNLVGQVVLAVSATFFVLGYLLMRRLSRVEV